MMNRIRWASIGCGSVDSIQEYESKKWRYAQIELCDGQLIAIVGRWWPWIGSQWNVWHDAYFRPLRPDFCRFFYAFPIRAPGFMSVLYCQSGPRTQYKTFHQGVILLDQIARIHRAQAIVCQAASHRFNERVMRRLGYERHALHLGDNHYIRRLEVTSLANQAA